MVKSAASRAASIVSNWPSYAPPRSVFASSIVPIIFNSATVGGGVHGIARTAVLGGGVHGTTGAQVAPGDAVQGATGAQVALTVGGGVH